MSNLVPIEQNNFSQGINLGMKQDLPFEKQDLQSVAWIENLTPNKVLGELITRDAQGQDEVNGNLVEGTMAGDKVISALEMTHGISSTPEKSVLHVFHNGEPSPQPTIRTSNIDRSDFDDGVWSNSDPFNFPVADYDVYGESVLLCSDSADVLDSPKRKPVYAYTFKDYEQYYGQKNELGQDLLLNGVTKPNITTKRWEVLDEANLEKIININWQTEDVPIDEEAKYLTAEAPLINGKIMQILGATTANKVQPGEIYDVVPKLTSFDIKAGSSSKTISAWGWDYEEINDPTKFTPSWLVGVGLLYEGLDVVAQQLGPVWGSAPFAGRKVYNQNDEPTTVYNGGAPAYTLTSFGKKFPVLWEVIDYVMNKKPRNFYVGERIPYVITAVINGIEKVVKKDAYTVHTDKEITIGVVSTFTKYNKTYTDPDPLVGTETKDEGAHDNFIAQRTASKRVNFNIEIDALMTDIPIGLSEIRLYIANKNVGERGMWNYVYPNLPSLNEVTDKTTAYSGWVQLPDSLYLNPDSDRESFSYSLAKSFVVFGDPDLYKRRPVDTDHSNWGVNNNKVNEWRLNGTKLEAVNNDGAVIRSEFYVWDYMDRVGEPLATNLGTGLILWKGKGAKVLSSMKGATFIGGCLDTIGKVEPGLIRKSLLQGAVQSTDTFAETDFIKVGNETHTALVEFRGQLWAFSRTQMHRIQMRDMSDLATVEVLEVLENNGTFSPKTVIATPFGVAWLNESGLWLSNGGEPQFLSKEVEPLYLHIVTGKEWIASNGDVLEWKSLDWLLTDTYNKALQIVYDAGSYDLVLSTYAIRKPNRIAPTGEDDQPLDFRLIYNMVYKNWRIETFKINLAFFDTVTSFGNVHRTHWSFTKYKSIGVNGNQFRVNTTATAFPGDFDTTLISNRLVLHEIGNGVDDMQANSVAIEAAYLLSTPIAIPKFTINTGEATGQFQFPGTQNVPSSINEGELVAYSIDGPTEPYWASNKIDTPIETPAERAAIYAREIPLKMTYNMTSQLHRVPFMKPVRRFVADYVVNGNVRLRSIRMVLRMFIRKFWG